MYEVFKASTILASFILVSFVTYLLLKRVGLFKDISNNQSKQYRIGRSIGVIVGLSLFCSSIAKFVAYGVSTPFLPMHAKLAQFGLTYITPLIFSYEISIGCLLVSKSAYKLGTLLGMVCLAGAVTSHLPTYADGIIWAIPSGSLFILLWISALLSAPEMFPDSITKGLKLYKNGSPGTPVVVERA